MSKREPAHFSQNDPIHHFRAKIGRFGVNFGKTITLPEFCRTLISFLGSVLTIFGSGTHQSPWASVSQPILLKFHQFLCIFGQEWGSYFIFLVLWINVSVIFHQFGCIPMAQRTQNAFRKSKPVFLDIWKKTSFFGLFVAIFLKIAVKSWIFPPKSCFIKKHMSFRSKIWNQIKKVIFRKFEIVPLLRHCAAPRSLDMLK